jgi:hypothetical protein
MDATVEHPEASQNDQKRYDFLFDSAGLGLHRII